MRRVFSIPILAALLTSSPVYAGITDQARPIVEHYVRATGGAPALSAETSLHSWERLDANKLRGTLEQWSQAPDKLAIRMTLGTLRLRMGYDGHTGWCTDLSSKRVRRLEGKELEKMASDAYFESEMWARDDQGGGAVTYGNLAMRSGQAFHSIDVKPPIGPSRRLWFNEKTGLMTRMTTRLDQHDAGLFYSDYKVLGGRKRPTLQDAVNQDYAFLYDETPVQRVRLDSLRVNAAADSGLFASPASDEGMVAWLKSAGVAHVDFRYGGRSVWIKASFNGAPPADFILDTGASTTAIDRDYARRIGLVKEGEFGIEGAGGSDVASIARVRSLRLAGSDGDGVRVNDLKVTIVDFGEGREEVQWRTMHGLIGYDVLSRFVMEIDYDRHVVTFRDPTSFAYSGAGSALDITLMGGVPVVRAQLDHGCTGDFLVDVGNSFGLIVHGSLVKHCGVFGRVWQRKQVKVYGGGVGSRFASWLCRLDTLQLGPFALPEPIAGLSLSTHGIVGSEDYAGNIGNGVLERFRCTFDYRRGKLYLEPGQRFAQRDRFSRIGAELLREGGRVVAAGIIHGSPADEAGLKDNDEVVSIDGKPALRFTPEEIDRLFVDGEIGSTHTFTILREGAREQLTITLQDVI